MNISYKIAECNLSKNPTKQLYNHNFEKSNFLSSLQNKNTESLKVFIFTFLMAKHSRGY